MPTISIRITDEDIQALARERNITLSLTRDTGETLPPETAPLPPDREDGRGRQPKGPSFTQYFERVITTLRNNGQPRTAETYRTTLNRLRRFLNGRNPAIGQVDAPLMEAFEAALRAEGLMMNTTSFYMRNIRAVYNRAVDEGIARDERPFRHVYTGVAKTVKRAVNPSTIRAIRRAQLPKGPIAFARDMFLFSFYTRGMSFVDMAYLRKTDLRNGVLVYRRKKTGQTMRISWEPGMQQIVDRYPTGKAEYLLPIITAQGERGRHQYRNMLYAVNASLRTLAQRLRLREPLTMYVARHSWASIAMAMNIPVEVISRAMGHTSEKTTQIYLKTLDTNTIDKANRRILKAMGEEE